MASIGSLPGVSMRSIGVLGLLLVSYICFKIAGEGLTNAGPKALSTYLAIAAAASSGFRTRRRSMVENSGSCPSENGSGTATGFESSDSNWLRMKRFHSPGCRSNSSGKFSKQSNVASSSTRRQLLASRKSSQAAGRGVSSTSLPAGSKPVSR